MNRINLISASLEESPNGDNNMLTILFGAEFKEAMANNGVDYATTNSLELVKSIVATLTDNLPEEHQNEYLNNIVSAFRGDAIIDDIEQKFVGITKVKKPVDNP